MRANKTELAYHYGLPHRSAHGSMVYEPVWITKVIRWRKEEIDSAHRALHQRIGTPVEEEFKA